MLKISRLNRPQGPQTTTDIMGDPKLPLELVLLIIKSCTSFSSLQPWLLVSKACRHHAFSVMYRELIIDYQSWQFSSLSSLRASVALLTMDNNLRLSFIKHLIIRMHLEPNQGRLMKVDHGKAVSVINDFLSRISKVSKLWIQVVYHPLISWIVPKVDLRPLLRNPESALESLTVSMGNGVNGIELLCSPVSPTAIYLDLGARPVQTAETEFLACDINKALILRGLRVGMRQVTDSDYPSFFASSGDSLRHLEILCTTTELVNVFLPQLESTKLMSNYFYEDGTPDNNFLPSFIQRHKQKLISISIIDISTYGHRYPTHYMFLDKVPQLLHLEILNIVMTPEDLIYLITMQRNLETFCVELSTDALTQSGEQISEHITGILQPLTHLRCLSVHVSAQLLYPSPPEIPSTGQKGYIGFPSLGSMKTWASHLPLSCRYFQSYLKGFPSSNTTFRSALTIQTTTKFRQDDSGRTSACGIKKDMNVYTGPWVSDIGDEEDIGYNYQLIRRHAEKADFGETMFRSITGMVKFDALECFMKNGRKPLYIRK